MSGATSPAYAQGGGGPGAGSRGVGQQDRHVIQMIANASLDVVEDVMRRESAMYVVNDMYWRLSIDSLCTIISLDIFLCY